VSLGAPLGYFGPERLLSIKPEALISVDDPYEAHEMRLIGVGVLVNLAVSGTRNNVAYASQNAFQIGICATTTPSIRHDRAAVAAAAVQCHVLGPFLPWPLLVAGAAPRSVGGWKNAFWARPAAPSR
jgi:hypothetical protein